MTERFNGAYSYLRGVLHKEIQERKDIAFEAGVLEVFEWAMKEGINKEQFEKLGDLNAVRRIMQYINIHEGLSQYYAKDQDVLGGQATRDFHRGIIHGLAILNKEVDDVYYKLIGAEVEAEGGE